MNWKNVLIGIVIGWAFGFVCALVGAPWLVIYDWGWVVVFGVGAIIVYAMFRHWPKWGTWLFIGYGIYLLNFIISNTDKISRLVHG